MATTRPRRSTAPVTGAADEPAADAPPGVGSSRAASKAATNGSRNGAAGTKPRAGRKSAPPSPGSETSPETEPTSLQGPYYSTAFIAKGIEVVLIGLLAVDFARMDGNPVTVIKAEIAELSARFGRRAAPKSSNA